jgi:hypothetical protein
MPLYGGPEARRVRVLIEMNNAPCITPLVSVRITTVRSAILIVRNQ